MLFKILKGASDRISLDVTPFHEGWCYFCSDDGGFYIDSEDNGEQKRTRINPENGRSTAIGMTLLASGWTASQQTVTVNGISAETNGVIGVAHDITEKQMEAVKSAELYISAQSAGTLTISAFGETPTVDIPVMLILLG